jgi:hypothetical protein
MCWLFWGVPLSIVQEVEISRSKKEEENKREERGGQGK